MSLLYLHYDPATEFNRLFEDASASRVCPRACTEAKPVAPKRDATVYRPRVDVHESKEANTVTATFELPGLTSDNVTIDVHQNRLTVSGESPVPTPGSETHGETDKGYTIRERRIGKFSRTLQLPFGTKPEDVKAKMEHGVLTISFPRTSPDQLPKRIVVA